jgi:hypothetical protein
MKKWQKFDTHGIYNEDIKSYVEWLTYGDNNEYFLSRQYYYEGDDIFDFEGDTGYVLINELITEDNTIEDLIKRTKEML